VVADDSALQSGIVNLLPADNYQVEPVTAADQAVSEIRRIQPNLVLLDMMMGGGQGLTVLNEIKSDPQLSSMPVVLLTVGEDNSQPTLAVGAEDYLPKNRLSEGLSAVLDKHSGNHPATEHVLVAEDDNMVREMIGRQLSREGWEVVLAPNGKVALEAMEERVPALVLLDLMMPKMDGFGVLREMRADDRLRHVPVVVLTSLDLTGSVRQLLQAQTDRVLQKGSFSRDELLVEIRSAIQEFGSRAPFPISTNPDAS
jgi:CheY-like chemotaxis protein